MSHALDSALKERLAQRNLTGSVRLAMAEPAPSGTALLTRTHPLTATLAEALVEASLDPEALSGLGIGRVGAWPTTAVQQMTRLALLRIRFKLTVHARKERLLLAEEAALVAIQGEQDRGDRRSRARTCLIRRLPPTWRPRRAIGSSRKRRRICPACWMVRWPNSSGRAPKNSCRTMPASAPRAGSASRVTVEAVMPPDVIGLFVLMPSEA